MKKIINFRPLLFIALSLCLGIATAYFLVRDKVVWAIFLIATFSVCCLLYLLLFSEKGKRKKNVIVTIVLVLVFIFGAISFNAQISSYSTDNLNGGYYQVEGRIKSVYQTDSGNKVVLDSASVKGALNGKLKYNLALNVYGVIDLEIGDVIVFYAHISDNSYIYEDRFNASDVERKIRYSASVLADQITKTDSKLSVFERVNIFIRDSLSKGLDSEEFSVGYALLTGDDAYMDYDLISAYRTAGVAHIFAVSGLHIGFLATALVFIFKKLNIRGYIRAIIITAILFFYSGVCGFTASSIRATIMTATVLFASAKGDRYDFLSSISLACIIILALSPVNLLCVGFQLSFLVVLGINLLSKPIARLVKFLPEKLATALGAVISAQLFSTPIMLMTFGHFSWISVVANMVFLPFVSIIFIFTFFACIIGGIFSISPITLFLPNYVLKVINAFIPVLDNDVFILGGIVFGSAIIAYYLSLILPCGIFRIKPKLKGILTVALVAVFAFTCTFNTVKEINSVKVYVSGSERVSATLIRDKSQSALIVSHTEYVYSISRLSRLKSTSGVDKINHLIFTNGYAIDMQVFISKIRTVFEIESVHYYGQKDVQTEMLLTRFLGIKSIVNHTDNSAINFGSTTLTYTLDGCALKGNINGKSVAIISTLLDFTDYQNFDGNGLDYMICYDRANLILSKFKPKNAISYLYSTIYKDAQNNGNLTLNLS